LLLFFFFVYVRTKAKSEAQITKLARAIALLDARLGKEQTELPDAEGRVKSSDVN
jgi:hypothetical protein